MLLPLHLDLDSSGVIRWPYGTAQLTDAMRASAALTDAPSTSIEAEDSLLASAELSDVPKLGLGP